MPGPALPFVRGERQRRPATMCAPLPNASVRWPHGRPHWPGSGIPKSVKNPPFTAISPPIAAMLAHHFTQAGLTDAAIEWWGKAGDQALRRSAFQEAISHLSKAIEIADKTGEGASAAATASASSTRRLKLQTDLGTALMWSRGFGADESKAAFIRARELAAAVARTPPSDLPFITVCGSATWCAASWGWHVRLPRPFCARLNAEHGRPSVGLAAAYWDQRASGGVISSRRKRIWLRR
jgi:hypothetical protein